MFNITDVEIEMLIADYKGDRTGIIPKYRLKELLKYGKMYVYGEQHFKSGKVVPCGKPFGLFGIHECGTYSPVELRGVKELDCVSGPKIHCWAGYNLAVVARNDILHAFFKRELLFKKQFQEVSAMAASAKKIYIGTERGEIVDFDPISQNKSVRQLHSGRVTCIELSDEQFISGIPGIPNISDNQVITGSADGTIFYGKRIRVSNSGIIKIQNIGSGRVVCACNDNRISIVDDYGVVSLDGHSSNILDLSFNGICVSSSLAGQFGFIGPWAERERDVDSTRPTMTMRNMGCSRHTFISSSTLLGFGLDRVLTYDLASESTSVISQLHSTSADSRENVVAYSNENEIHFRDIRSGSSFAVQMAEPITGLSFSESGSILLVVAEERSYMLNLRYL